MAKHTVLLPSKKFGSKKEAQQFFREMLHHYEDGDEIKDEDESILFELLQRHPEAKEKIGCGAKGFYRNRSPNHPTSCFHIERNDGTTTDFSFNDCVSSSKPTLEQYFYRACRSAITESLTARKNKIFQNGPVNCHKTGIEVTKEEAEYRHTTPRFRDIVKSFQLSNNININKEMFVESDDMQYITEFIDPALASKFLEFHSQHATLEIYKKFER
ncbi:MAG: DCL family protein [Desulfobulbaceae bacterium]|nr:DCL family protein [Desulfobulbaceae bacterium]